MFLTGASLCVGSTSALLSDLPRAREHLERGVALYDPQQHRSHISLFGEDVGISCLGWEAYALWGLGYPEQALHRVQEALSLAQQFSHPFSLGYALSCVVRIHQFRREEPATQARAETLLELAAEQGFALRTAQGFIMRGWALAMQGHAEEGIALLRQGLAAFRVTGAEFHRPVHLTMLAEAYGKVEQTEEGLGVLAEALDAVNNTGERFWEAELYRLKGQLTLQSQVPSPKSRVEETLPGRVSIAHQNVSLAETGTVGGAHPTVEAEAERCFLKAIEIARQQQAKSLELRAVMSLARLWRQQGKKEEARRMLAEIYGWFIEGFDTKDLQEAKVLLEELNH